MKKEKKATRSWLAPAAPRPGQWPSWILKRLLTLLVTFSALVLGGGLIFKDRLIFHPSADAIDSPAYYGLTVEEFWLEPADGVKLRAWQAPAPPEAPADRGGKIAIVLQGNSGNISMMSSRLGLLNSLGLAVLAVDYPGYGPNEGQPSEAKVYQAAEAAWQWAAKEGYRPEDILVYGYSLGGGVAAWLAEGRRPGVLILDSTFTRLRDVPADQWPWMSPYFYLILGDAFDTRSRLARINCPLLVIHSPSDEVVPYALGRELFEGYRNNCKDMAIGKHGHTDFHLNRDLYREKIETILLAAWPPEGK